MGLGIHNHNYAHIPSCKIQLDNFWACITSVSIFADITASKYSLRSSSLAIGNWISDFFAETWFITSRGRGGGKDADSPEPSRLCHRESWNKAEGDPPGSRSWHEGLSAVLSTLNGAHHSGGWQATQRLQVHDESCGHAENGKQFSSNSL